MYPPFARPIMAEATPPLPSAPSSRLSCACTHSETRGSQCPRQFVLNQGELVHPRTPPVACPLMAETMAGAPPPSPASSPAPTFAPPPSMYDLRGEAKVQTSAPPCPRAEEGVFVLAPSHRSAHHGRGTTIYVSATGLPASSVRGATVAISNAALFAGHVLRPVPLAPDLARGREATDVRAVTPATEEDEIVIAPSHRPSHHGRRRRRRRIRHRLSRRLPP